MNHVEPGTVKPGERPHEHSLMESGRCRYQGCPLNPSTNVSKNTDSDTKTQSCTTNDTDIQEILDKLWITVEVDKPITPGNTLTIKLPPKTILEILALFEKYKENR